MIRLLLTILLTVFINRYSQAQKIEVFGGVNKNTFYDRDKDIHFSSSYTPGRGYSFGIAIDSFRKKKRMNHRLTLNFDNYSGGLAQHHTFLGGADSIRAKVNKSVISIGFFPVNLRFRKILELNFGFEYSRLIHEKVSGETAWWTWSRPWDSQTKDLKSIENFNSKAYLGIKTRIALEFEVWKSVSIIPQYLFYLGSEEFTKYTASTHSARHLFCLGIKRRIK